ncbi:hypothetical protein CSUI_002403 [Cystoisospora suis]|uniref:Uncharacterized protein n=1 Tax=Cystoisospora suis TaxID=483139 RepID=A0A2C6L8Y5_9APIC|nr:hypothetical protein CSUI_002403 [Cystoisospora suis]
MSPGWRMRERKKTKKKKERTRRKGRRRTTDGESAFPTMLGRIPRCIKEKKKKRSRRKRRRRKKKKKNSYLSLTGLPCRYTNTS